MSSNFVIMGLPASGKTTFLAALWHLVEAEETATRLRLHSYEGDLSYLNRIAQAWRTFQKVPRTSQIGDVNVKMHLVDTETGNTAVAFFPDLAGETFDAQVLARRCRPEFVEALSKEEGVLFFITADVKGDGLSVVELNSLLPEEGGEPIADGIDEGEQQDKDGDEQPQTLTATTVEWTPHRVPTQVRVVQILSDLIRPPFEPKLRRLAVIISAWDLTDGSGLDPRAWLDTRMPLVSQFLQSNKVAFEHQIYGVSAQGANLDDGVAVAQLSERQTSRRIRVVGTNEEGHDLTAPLVWIMSK